MGVRCPHTLYQTHGGSNIMRTFTIPVTTKNGQTVRVTVLADNEANATIIAVKAHGVDPLIADAIDVIQNGEFRNLWPLDVRKALVRAANHEGPLPAFGASQVAWAVKTAWKVEDHYRKQEEQAQQVLANLPASERAKVNA